MNAIEFENGSMLINFDEPGAVFYSGQKLSGRLMLNLDKPIRFKAINILYHGMTTVSWSEFEGVETNGQNRTIEVKYHGQQRHFQELQCLSGGEGIWQLNTGPHTIPFQYMIPKEAPSSFKSQHGEVAYYVAVNIEYPDILKKNDEVVKYFKVIAALDLNKANPAVREPIEFDTEDSVGCGWFGTGFVTSKIRLPVSAYCPGQKIPISVMVNNESGFEVKKIIFDLYMKKRYTSQNPPSEYISPERVLSSKKVGTILANSKKEFTCHLDVPDMIAVNLENCNIIDLGYFIKVTMKLSGCNDDIFESREICIGLVPLANTVTGQYIHPMKSELPIAPVPDPNKPIEPVYSLIYPAELIKTGIYATPSAPSLDADAPKHDNINMNSSEPGFKISGFNIAGFSIPDISIPEIKMPADGENFTMTKTSDDGKTTLSVKYFTSSTVSYPKN